MCSKAQGCTIGPSWRRALWLAGVLLPLAGLPAAVDAEHTMATAQIRIDHHVLEVEIADTVARRERGLMWRTELPDGTGMLFIFKRPQRLSFWMKNTPIDLDLGFFGEDRRLQQIETMRALDLTHHDSTQPALYALEVRRGWYRDNAVRIGARLYLPPR